ncbi:hypothetical protein M0804_013702 [Polistes exclamans]|nr:hypothetical protein M0804_013701 [Polistes exclamans]KAI4476286.1 hypothetical protein M0804_013702 [Polistes exclamans]
MCCFPSCSSYSSLFKLIDSRDSLKNRKDNLVIFITNEGETLDKCCVSYATSAMCVHARLQDITVHLPKDGAALHSNVQILCRTTVLQLFHQHSQSFTRGNILSSRQNLKKAKIKSKVYYDRKVVEQDLKVGGGLLTGSKTKEIW